MTVHRWSPILAAILTAALWSTAYVAPAAVKPVGDLLLVTSRYTIFALCGVAVLVLRREALRAMTLRRIAFALHLGAVGYLVFYLCVSYAVTAAGGFVVAILVGCSPVTIAVVGNALDGRVPWRLFAPAVAAIAVGIVVVVAGGSGSRALGQDLAAGVPLALLASAVWSYFVVVNARVQQRWTNMPPPEVWSALVALGAGAGSLLLVPSALTATPPETFEPAVLMRFALWVGWLAFVTSWLGTYVWVRASRNLPASLAGPLLACDPIFGAILSLAFEHRLPSPTEFAGGALILIGVAACLFLDRPLAPRPAPAS